MSSVVYALWNWSLRMFAFEVESLYTTPSLALSGATSLASVFRLLIYDQNRFGFSVRFWHTMLLSNLYLLISFSLHDFRAWLYGVAICLVLTSKQSASFGINPRICCGRAGRFMGNNVIHGINMIVLKDNHMSLTS